MSKIDRNENEMEREKIEETERVKKRTIERMLAGAKEEEKQFRELQNLRKDLKFQLEVFFLLKSDVFYFILVSAQNGFERSWKKES